MLFFDIAITFGDEVERIWKRRFTGATVLWFIVRQYSRYSTLPHEQLRHVEPIFATPRLYCGHSLYVQTIRNSTHSIDSPDQPSMTRPGARLPARHMSCTRKS